MKLQFCSNCGEQLPADAKFCLTCGTQLASSSSKAVKPARSSETVTKAPQIHQTYSEPRISRTPELVLGLIGGVLGLLFVPVMFFIGIAAQVFTGNSSTIFPQAVVAALISIIGLIAAVFVRNKPKESGATLVVCGVIGFIVASGFYVGGLLLLVAGILALVRKDPQSKEDLSFLAEENVTQAPKVASPIRKTGLRGSFPLDAETIDAEVTAVSSGVFALGLKKANVFHVHYVSRSDSNVNAELKKYVGKYDRFKFDYTASPESAFKMECDLYHKFHGPQGRLDNEQHPDRPSEVTSVCPTCGS